MKRHFFGIVIAVFTFLSGIGTNAVLWPDIPNFAAVEDLQVLNVDPCEFEPEPWLLSGRIIRVSGKYYGGTNFGRLLSRTNRSHCSNEIMVTCRTNANCWQDWDDYGKTFAVTGRFSLDEESHFRYKIEDARVEGPMVTCWDNSVAESLSECPVYREIEFRVDGVGVGNSYREVVNALGPPLKRIKGRYHDVAQEREITLKYDGLDLDMLYKPDRSVVSFQVSSPKWDVSGIRIGDDESILKSKFGNIFYQHIDDPEMVK